MSNIDEITPEEFRMAMFQQALIQLVLLEDALQKEMAKDTPNAEYFYELFWEIMNKGAKKHEHFTDYRH